MYLPTCDLYNLWFVRYVRFLYINTSKICLHKICFLASSVQNCSDMVYFCIHISKGLSLTRCHSHWSKSKNFLKGSPHNLYLKFSAFNLPLGQYKIGSMLKFFNTNCEVTLLGIFRFFAGHLCQLPDLVS